MASIEELHLSKIMETGNFRDVLEAQISPDFYKSPLNKEVFQYILTFYKDPLHLGEVPSFDLVSQDFPRFPYSPNRNSIVGLNEELRKEKVRTDIQYAAQEAIDISSDDPFAAVENWRSRLSSIQTIASSQREDVDLAQSAEGFLATMDAISAVNGLIGLPYPWECLNRETGGIQDEEFIILYGRPKSKKTWLLLYIAMNIYLRAHSRVLFYTREMSVAQIMRRAYCILTRSDYREFKNWKLQSNTKDWVRDTLMSMGSDEDVICKHTGRRKQFIITTDKMDRRGGSVDSLQRIIETHQPDVVFVDAMYLMRDSRTGKKTVDWKNMYHISEDLKATAQLYNLPIVGTNQAKQSATNTRGEEMNEQAYADAFNQDCDMAMRIIPGKDPETNKPEITVAIPGMREGTLEAFVIDGQCAQSFDLKREVSEYEATKAQGNDSKVQASKKRADNSAGKSKLYTKQYKT